MAASAASMCSVHSIKRVLRRLVRLLGAGHAAASREIVCARTLQARPMDRSVLDLRLMFSHRLDERNHQIPVGNGWLSPFVFDGSNPISC